MPNPGKCSKHIGDSTDLDHKVSKRRVIHFPSHGILHLGTKCGPKLQSKLNWKTSAPWCSKKQQEYEKKHRDLESELEKTTQQIPKRTSSDTKKQWFRIREVSKTTKSRDLQKVLVVSPLILVSQDQIGR